MSSPKYPGIRLTANGNQLVSYYTESRITDAGIFYPITPSTEMGELYEQSFAEGKLNVFGASKVALECEGEHAAQGGAIAFSVTGKRVVNFTSGQGIVYGLEQYYHAPGKLSTMVLEVGARALTKHALNVHCGHDDVYAALDTGWIVLFAKDAQQAADQAVILRRVTEQCLNPGMNAQDGFLTTHLERTFYRHESELLREFLGAPEDIIDCPTEAQRTLFGPTRRRVPEVIDLKNPMLLGPVQNQEHYMNGVVARRNNFSEDVLPALEESHKAFAALTGRHYGLISPYKVDDAKTVFVSLGSAAENVEAAVDHLRATRGSSVGSVHVNCIRPFPEAAIVEALAGKENIIILERTDESLAGSNPLARDIRTSFLKALDGDRDVVGKRLPEISGSDIPTFLEGIYGLGSRDFRPEGILGAYEYSQGETTRVDGNTVKDGYHKFVVGVDHPYSVVSSETPSLLPEGATAVRLHSIGGWGMITTGKNLASVIGAIGDSASERSGEKDESGRLKEVIHVSANPKYGSEKKGAPTSYFLVAAPERIRTNCDLRHVNTVLCCDPKAFTHTNPIDGLVDGGAFVWESELQPSEVWERIPKRYRQMIFDKNIRVYTLPGFRIAREATDRPDLQLRMQGNAFLGAFFGVSTFLKDYDIDVEDFKKIVHAQYMKKFGRFGEGVVNSNMKVMTDGMTRVQAVAHGDVNASDYSSMRGSPLLPIAGNNCGTNESCSDSSRPPVYRTETFDKEFRSGYGYHQPASTLASVGMVAAATGATASKSVARRQTPIFYPDKCTQCMSCIAVCPDTALPNTAQTVDNVLTTAAEKYVSNEVDRSKIINMVPTVSAACRAEMQKAVKDKAIEPFMGIMRRHFESADISAASRDEFYAILDQVPLAYGHTKQIFSSLEKKSPGDGGLFSIFVSDLCKGCGECVVACGSHEALEMVPDTEELNAQLLTATHFMEQLPQTPRKYFGIFDPDNPADSKAAVLHNHLMQVSNYQALVSGDGACAGCGEKTVLRGVATLTEAYMRPLYHAKADRLNAKAEDLMARGTAQLQGLAKNQPESYALLQKTIAHLLMGYGGESSEDTDARLEGVKLDDAQVVDALVTVLRQDAHNHRSIQSVDGRLSNGMSVMAMGAHTGCNSVYGSTPPNNPHPYPWMNSLFQDGTTVAWMFGESFMRTHSKRSVLPERLADLVLSGDDFSFSEGDYFTYTHFGDALMTDQEIRELPKAWAIGGDGGMGDIGFQNVSKVVLQNRPNVKVLMLDTQVYSNTGGQNSDSSVMPGGFDMNQWGAASQGKLTEKKSLAEIFAAGHGSPYVAQVSAGNIARFYQAILEGLDYRGVAFYQCFTTCQPEHGVGDDVAFIQAQRARDSRGVPEFVFDPTKGETYGDALSVKGNPHNDQDWWKAKRKSDKKQYAYTPAHWAATEARFRRHLKNINADKAKDLIHLDDLLLRMTQQDVVHRRFFDANHRAHVTDFATYIEVEVDGSDKPQCIALSRQMVLFCVERRRAWRMLQSRAGIANKEWRAQQSLLKKVDSGKIELSEFLEKTNEFFAEELKAAK